MSAASDITRKARSNLAFALNILPREQRQDMVIFYAFCRTMDDLADDTEAPAEQRTRALESWKNGLLHGFDHPDAFQQDVVSMLERREIPKELPIAIIDGCMMDLHPQRFQTREQLDGYVWKVACAVGLVSIRLFGCKDPGSEQYAVALGQALQLTNILRDVSEDLENGGRIYLPLEDLARFGYTERDLTARVMDGRFLALMAYEADRADALFHKAETLLPPADRQAMLPARIMGEIYHAVLEKMRDDRFQVFKKRYRLSKARKLLILSKHLIARSR